MKRHKLSSIQLKSTFVLISCLIIAQSSEVDEVAVKITKVETEIKNVELDPNFVPPVAVNPHLEVLDEKYSKCGQIDIREASVLDLQKLFATGNLTTVELTKCYLERLDRLNDALRVVVEVNRDALQDAAKLDAERKEGKVLGPMHGIPVLLKDAIGTLDSTETTVGSPVFIGLRPKKEADVVTSLRKAGALILGKSHCQEFYGLRGSNIPYGWSGRGGQTRNAYNLSVTPSGSSSGSAVGVAAGLIPVAVGSETDGSIIDPASLLGIVGMKPTIGLPSVKGAIPLSHNQDHLGPMARTVLDAAALLDGMVSDEEQPKNHPASYSKYLLENNDTDAFRVGVLRFPYWDTAAITSSFLAEQLPHLNKMVELLQKSKNFEVVDPVETPFTNISVSKMYTVVHHDFKHELNEYLKTDVEDLYSSSHSTKSLPESTGAYISAISPTKNITSLQDIINYIDEHPSVYGFNQDYLLTTQATDGLLNETYIEARDSNKAATKEFLDSLLEKYNLDAIMVPGEPRVGGIVKPGWEDFPSRGCTLACIVGYPSIVIPAGIGSDHVPFGILFIAKPYQDHKLLLLAHAAEQLNPQRKTPQFKI